VQLDLVCKVIWPGMSYKKVLTRLKVKQATRSEYGVERVGGQEITEQCQTN